MFAALKALLSKWFQPTPRSELAKGIRTISENLGLHEDDVKSLSQNGNIESSRTFSELVPYDEDLLERSRTQWQFGDWDSLADISRESLQHHPDRAKLALLAAAGKMQKNQMLEARQLIQLAQDWGVSRKLVTQILASGVHNSLACASSLAGQEDRATQHFEAAVNIGAPSSDGRLLLRARMTEQLHKLNLASAVSSKITNKGVDTGNVIPESKLDKIAIEAENKKKIKDYLKKAIELKSQEKYIEAEFELQQILKLDPSNDTALRELGKINSLQKKWDQASQVYDQILKTQKVSIDAILQKTKALRNQDKLEQIIITLEGAKAIGMSSTQIEYQLAIAYRDTQQWNSLKRQVDEIIVSDPEYAKRIDFATFAADALRKQGRATEAYKLLLVAVDSAKINGLEVPLITDAMLEELSCNDKQSKNNQSEVSKYFYDNIYAKSKKYKLDSNESIYLPVWKSVVDHIESLDAKSVLDIGCGPGQFAEYLFSRMPEIIYAGIDFSEVAINQAKERCSKGQFLVHNIIEKDAFKNFNADVYILLEVLEHVEQDREIISSIIGNKEVIFSVPNFDSFGHVRFFRDEKQVKSRYEFEFEELRIKSIILNGRSKIFLSSGLRIKN